MKSTPCPVIPPIQYGIDDFVCPACCSTFTNSQGRNSHLQQSRACLWYRKACRNSNGSEDQSDISVSESDEGRLSTISDTPDVISCATPFATNISFGYDNPMSDVEEANPEDPDSVMAEFDNQMEDLLDFAFPPSLQMPFQSGLTSGTMVEDYQPVSVPLVDDDTRVFDEDAMHGRCVRSSPPSSISQEASNVYAPFSSELEWQIAEWCIKETTSHSAVDRFLAIPGVS